MFTLIIYILIAAVGLTMVFIYKQTNTTAQLLKPDPEKIKKIFTWVLVIASFITFTLSWFTTYELTASSMPLEGSIQYQNYKMVMIFVLNFSFLAMIILANTYSLTLKKISPWPYLLALAFYAIFVLKDAYIISDYFSLWQKSLKMLKGDLPDFHSTAWFKCWMGAAVTAFNAIIVWLGLRN